VVASGMFLTLHQAAPLVAFAHRPMQQAVPVGSGGDGGHYWAWTRKKVKGRLRLKVPCVRGRAAREGLSKRLKFNDSDADVMRGKQGCRRQGCEVLKASGAQKRALLAVPPGPSMSLRSLAQALRARARID